MKRDTAEILDPARIALLRELERHDSAGLLTDLVEIFLAEVPRRLKAIRLALDQGDQEILRKESHLLGGGAANLGACFVQEHAAELELWAKQAQGTNPEQCYLQLEAECQRACAALVSLAEENRGSA